MNINEIKRLLSDRNLREVSRRTGISYSTLRNLVKIKHPDPNLSTVEKLQDYFNTTIPGWTNG
jgi:transcriptional regulator with XRE-family HTH domain